MRFITLLLILLAGCASTPEESDIPAASASWHGAAYEEVVRSWGAPARSTKLPDGRDAHTWVSESVAPSRVAFWPSIGIFGGSGDVGFGTGVTMGPGYGGELVRCERTLFLENGRVVDQTWQGPPDYCGSFRRY